jgi:hypothetical protein
MPWRLRTLAARRPDIPAPTTMTECGSAAGHSGAVEIELGIEDVVETEVDGEEN